MAEGYGVYALHTNPGAVGGGAIAAWVSSWVYIPAFIAVPAALFLVFPTGRLPGPRWRPVLVLVIVATAAAMAAAALAPVLDDAPFAGLRSPLPVGAPPVVRQPLSWLGWPGMTLALVLSSAAMVVRLRRSRGLERQQLKWIGAAALLLPVATLIGVVCYYVGVRDIGGLLVSLAFVPVPLAAGYAILRHRLYDIDVVINRALVYGTLTALLAGAYLALVLLLGVLLSPLTAESDLAVAMSTLTVAVLFQPLRRRVQGLVDRRFYRRRYDAARTLERFGAGLRAHVDVETLGSELTTVVRDTMQPAHVSLWRRADVG